MIPGGTREGADLPKGFEQQVTPHFTPIQIRTEPNNYPICNIPLYLAKVPAGFPSPAEDYIANNLDLNEYLIKHPAATFLVRATGNSMLNAGIHENDILIVDRSITPTSGKIVIAAIDGQLTVKRLHKQRNGKYILKPDNPAHPLIELQDGNEVHIWGVVTNIIHAV